MNSHHSSAAPSAFDNPAQGHPASKGFGGLQRRLYVGLSALIGFAHLRAYLSTSESLSQLALFGVQAGIAGLPVMAFFRCKNIGINPWWCLGMFVPVLNIFVQMRCLACPEGYTNHRTMDAAGKCIIALAAVTYIPYKLYMLRVAFLFIYPQTGGH